MPSLKVNNRTHERNRLIVGFEVVDKTSEAVLGYLANISESGMLLISDNPLPPTAVRQVILKPTDCQPLAARPIEAEIEIKWTCPDDGQNAHRVGCYFLYHHPKTPSVNRQLDRVLGFDPRLYYFTP